MTHTREELLDLCRCSECPFGQNGQRAPVLGNGPDVSPLIVVGEAPGRMEARGGLPFQGPAGRVLNGLLAGVGMPREKVYATNTVLCRPPVDHLGKDSAPPKAAIEACRARLEAEVRGRGGKVLLAMGRTAAQSLLDSDDNISNLKGVTTWSDSLGMWILPTVHPAAVLHAGDEGERLAEDILRTTRRAAMIARGEHNPERLNTDTLKTTYVTDYARASRIIERIAQGGHGYGLALDIETGGTGFDTILDPIRLVAVSTPDSAVIFDHELLKRHPAAPSGTIKVGPDGRHLNWTLFRRLLCNRRFTWYLHNCSFDLQFLARDFDLGHSTLWQYKEGRQVEDTMCWALGTTEKGDLTNLKRLSRELLNAPYYEDEIRKYLAGKGKGKGEGYSFDRVPRDVLARYGGLDTIMTARLLPILQKEAAVEGTTDLVRNLLIPAQLAFTEIEREGTYADLEYARGLKEEWVPRIAAMKAEIQKYAQEAGFDARTTMKSPTPKSDPLLNPGSPKQLVGFLYGKPSQGGLGLKPPPTPEGRKSPPTGREFREAYPDHPVSKMLGNYTKVTKIISTYVDGIIDDVKADGRVHPSFLIIGTITGRIAIHKPPLQTLPAEYTIESADIDLPAVRPIFAATPKDHPTNPWNEDLVFVSVDYERLELYVAWMLTGDEAIGRALMSGDFHRVTAAQVYGVPPEEVTKMQRRDSKLVTFGIMYGRGAPSLAKQMANPKEAPAFVAKWLETFKGYATVREEWAKEVLEGSGRLTTPYGRVRRWLYQAPDLRNHIKNQAYNFKIQSVASDITLESMIILNHELHDRDLGRVLFTVHDSINFEVRRSCQLDAVRLIFKVMQDPQTLRPYMRPDEGLDRFPIEMHLGDHWGDVEWVFTWKGDLKSGELVLSQPNGEIEENLNAVLGGRTGKKGTTRDVGERPEAGEPPDYTRSGG